MQVLLNVWDFFQKQILGLRWLNTLIGNLLQTLGMNSETKLFSALQFFIYDSFKIFFLLSVLIFIISYIQSFFTPQKTRRILGGIKGLKGRAMGALLGILTPFCSCSSIPLFIGFSSAGLPIGVTLSFLIMSPMADLGSLTIVSYGVMSMPALVINEKVVSMGKALKTGEIIKLLKKLGYC